MTIKVDVFLTPLADQIMTAPDTSGSIRIFGPADGAVARDLFRRGKKIERKAKQLCPVDTGRLRTSIHTVTFYANGEPGVRVGSDVNYAGYVHDGTRHMRGRPFLYNAIDAAR